MNREQFIIPVVRKALIFGCQDSYNFLNNEDRLDPKKGGLKQVHSDMDKLLSLFEDLEFTES